MSFRDRDEKALWQRLAQAIGHTRFIVFIAVLAVLLVAICLFLLGAYEAVTSVAGAWPGVVSDQVDAAEVTVVFLRVVVLMLEAVAFFIVGVGLYGLFLAPLNITEALGVETLGDLEERVLSVIVVILAVTLLEHFITGGDPMEHLQRAGAFAAVVAAIVAFKFFSHRSKVDRDRWRVELQERSKRDMFNGSEELHEMPVDRESRREEA